MCRAQTGQSKQENYHLVTFSQLPHLLDVVVTEDLREVLLGLRQNVQPEERRPAGRDNVFQSGVEICADTERE